MPIVDPPTNATALTYIREMNYIPQPYLPRPLPYRPHPLLPKGKACSPRKKLRKVVPFFLHNMFDRFRICQEGM